MLRYWPFGEPWCRIWLSVDVWMCTASIYNLVAISIDRYIAVSRPVRYASLMSPSRAKLLIVAVWILSFVICFPPLIGWNGGHTGQYNATADADLHGHRENVTQSSLSSTGLLYCMRPFHRQSALHITVRPSIRPSVSNKVKRKLDLYKLNAPM